MQFSPHKAAALSSPTPHRADDPGKIRCSQMVTVTVPGCSHQLTVPCGSSQGYRAGTTPCTQDVQVTLPGCGHTLKLPCGKAALAVLDPTACKEACGGLLQGCEHVCSSKCGACMQKLLESSSSSTSGAAAEQRAFLQAFLSNLQVDAPQLHRIWSDWCDDNAAGVQSQQQHQRWLRFLRDALAPALGSLQCQQLSTPASADASSSAMTWPAYLSSCRSLGSGKFAHERLAAEWHQLHATSSSSTSLGPWQKPHLPCSKTCDKPLACGHSCLQKCHQGSSCGPCRQPCSIHCEHAKCSLQCAAPCAPCAEPCGWYCEHKGACLLPCGVPCDREPCNMRCSKLLECGHRCPGLCGEVCLLRKYCVHADCMAKAPQSVKSRVRPVLFVWWAARLLGPLCTLRAWSQKQTLVHACDFANRASGCSLPDKGQNRLQKKPDIACMLQCSFMTMLHHESLEAVPRSYVVLFHAGG